MELLREITEKDIGGTAVEDFERPYKLRKAARAVILNSKNEIALMTVTKHGYHKLPGGGVDEGEDLHTALKRESLEEAGASIEIGQELGAIIEYRNWLNLIQISYCFMAKQVGELSVPALEQGEINDGFELVWMPLDQAIAQLEQDHPDSDEGKMIQIRDLRFLRKAQEAHDASSLPRKT